ncbi:MAG: hypothetical protein IJ881_10070 [Neisseriaceae bacterium]|nr:hypothetical protein [Neisseriaceae bacterium]
MRHFIYIARLQVSVRPIIFQKKRHINALLFLTILKTAAKFGKFDDFNG